MSDYFVEGFDLRGKPSTDRLFLAEGYSEVGYLEKALETRNAARDQTTILCFKGVARMGHHTDTIVKLLGAEAVQNLRAIGIIADSEDDPSGRIDVIIGCAKSFGFPRCATDLRLTGRHEDGGRKFAMSLSPTQNQKGRIEKLILREIAPNGTMKCILDSLNCISEANKGRPVDEKAQVQMYISAAMNSSMAGIRQGFLADLFKVTDNAYAGHLGMVDFILA